MTRHGAGHHGATPITTLILKLFWCKRRYGTIQTPSELFFNKFMMRFMTDKAHLEARAPSTVILCNVALYVEGCVGGHSVWPFQSYRYYGNVVMRGTETSFLGNRYLYGFEYESPISIEESRVRIFYGLDGKSIVSTKNFKKNATWELYIPTPRIRIRGIEPRATANR